MSSGHSGAVVTNVETIVTGEPNPEQSGNAHGHAKVEPPQVRGKNTDARRPQVRVKTLSARASTTSANPQVTDGPSSSPHKPTHVNQNPDTNKGNKHTLATQRPPLDAPSEKTSSDNSNTIRLVKAPHATSMQGKLAASTCSPASPSPPPLQGHLETKQLPVINVGENETSGDSQSSKPVSPNGYINSEASASGNAIPPVHNHIDSPQLHLERFNHGKHTFRLRNNFTSVVTTIRAECEGYDTKVNFSIVPLNGKGSPLYHSVVVRGLQGWPGVLYGMVFPTNNRPHVMLPYTSLSEFVALRSLAESQQPMDDDLINLQGHIMYGNEYMPFGTVDYSSENMQGRKGDPEIGWEVPLSLNMPVPQLNAKDTIDLNMTRFSDGSMHPISVVIVRMPNVSDATHVPANIITTSVHVKPMVDYRGWSNRHNPMMTSETKVLLSEKIGMNNNDERPHSTPQVVDAADTREPTRFRTPAYKKCHILANIDVGPNHADAPVGETPTSCNNTKSVESENRPAVLSSKAEHARDKDR